MTILLAAVGAILLAWLVIRTSVVDALVVRNPFAAAAVAPRHPNVQIAMARAEFALRNGRVSEASQSAAEQALGRAPLAAEPFLLAGVAALASGEAARGEALLAESRRRHPRSRIVHLLLLDRDLRANRIEAAVESIATLSRLMPQAGAVLVPELARMVQQPETGASLIRVLGRNQQMKQAVLEQLARDGGDPDLIFRIAGPGRGLQEARWQGILMTRLIEEGDVTGAYAIWRGLVGQIGPTSFRGVYDGQFRGLRGDPPFNWQLMSGAAGVAALTKTSSLQVEYYGRERVDLASQLLMLAPGRYRLQFRAEGDAPGEGSKLAWTLACRTSGAQLAAVPLANISSAPRMLSGDFTVPGSGCSSQWLRLSGAPAEFPTAQSVTISDVRVDRRGAR